MSFDQPLLCSLHSCRSSCKNTWGLWCLVFTKPLPYHVPQRQRHTATQEKVVTYPEVGTGIQSSYLDTRRSSLCICQLFVFLTAAWSTAMFHGDVPLIYVFSVCSSTFVLMASCRGFKYRFFKMSSHLCIKILSEFLAYHFLCSCLWINACEKIAFY